MKDEVFELQASLEESHWWFLGRRAILRALIAAILPPHSGGTLIDIGCGTGGNIGGLTEGYRCVGLEPAPAALALARKRYPSVQFVAAGEPALAAPYVTPRTVFLLTDVLEHVPDDFLFFSQLLAVMPAGSHLLLTVPANPGLWSPHDLALAHYRRYDIGRLRLVWRDLPVRERLVSPFNARLYPLVRLRRAFAGLRHTGSGGRGTDLSLPPGPVNRLLAKLFAGERVPLLRALSGDGAAPFRGGVSLLALLEREPGQVVPRTRPLGVPPDGHDPRTG
ncbi:MAG TPA: methyltransferase domain-containing protein [Gemmatimonadales bacterium]|nr:methyltransferase domain-containing protein [Gemmatimonadales bacterium]